MYRKGRKQLLKGLGVVPLTGFGDKHSRVMPVSQSDSVRHIGAYMSVALTSMELHLLSLHYVRTMAGVDVLVDILYHMRVD
jgi:hypothetical protein